MTMNNVERIIQHAEQQCKSRGARLTVKRKQILTGLVESSKALSAYELIDFCNQRYGHNLPPMSVYRILDFLEQQDLVHKLNLANKYVASVHITCDHERRVPQFLICRSCNKVKEFSVNESTISEFSKSATNAGFEFYNPQVELNCLCSSCIPPSS